MPLERPSLRNGFWMRLNMVTFRYCTLETTPIELLPFVVSVSPNFLKWGSGLEKSACGFFGKDLGNISHDESVCSHWCITWPNIFPQKKILDSGKPCTTCVMDWPHEGQSFERTMWGMRTMGPPCKRKRSLIQQVRPRNRARASEGCWL